MMMAPASCGYNVSPSDNGVPVYEEESPVPGEDVLLLVSILHL